MIAIAITVDKKGLPKSVITQDKFTISELGLVLYQIEKVKEHLLKLKFNKK